MMMSPEGYYMKYLKGKNEKQIMTAVRGLKQKAELFDASVPAICRVIFSIGGYFKGYETRIITLDEEHLYFDAAHKPSGPPAVLNYSCSKDEFLDGIRDLHIGEWRTSYIDFDALQNLLGIAPYDENEADASE